MFRLPNASLDLGFNVLENGRVWKIALIFLDILVNTREKSLVVGFGVPFYKAYCCIFTTNKELRERVKEMEFQSKEYWRMYDRKIQN